MPLNGEEHEYDFRPRLVIRRPDPPSPWYADWRVSLILSIVAVVAAVANLLQ